MQYHVIINTRYQKIYNTLSELINRSPQLESFKMDGIVCPICQERAIYDYGYGKGIIKIDDLLTNSANSTTTTRKLAFLLELKYQVLFLKLLRADTIKGI
jgi:hypothetical protein